jgi:predicted MFS family arabinose efflux permease
MLIIPVFLPGDLAVAVGSERSTDAPLPRAVWWLTAYAALLGAGAGATFAFNALYAEERLGFSKQWAGLLVGMTGLVAGVTRIALSHITQTSRRFGVPLGNIALGASISLVVIAAAPTLGAWSLWLGAAAAAATLGSWNSVAMLAAMSTVTPDLVGRATGRVMLGFLAGLGVVPPLFGTAVDRWDAYEEAWLVLAGSAFVGFLVMRLWVAEEGRHDSFGDTPGREVS